MSGHSQSHGHSHGAKHLGPELRDADMPLVFWTGMAILVTVVVCFVLAAALYNMEMSRFPQTSTNVFAEARAKKLPPLPRLQAVPGKDLVEFKKAQQSVADTFGWADKEAGIARIPVNRAAEMILKNGVPAPVEKPAPAQGTAAPTGGKKQ